METETNMTIFQNIVSSAFKLFSRQNGKPISYDSLNDLKNCLTQVTRTDLGIDPWIVEDRIPGVDEAPVTYIKILEHKVLTVAVFVLKHGKSLPLHDHPNMFGLLKVVHGTVRIKSYSLLDRDQYPVPTSVEERLKAGYGPKVAIFPSRINDSKLCSESDECCVIVPDKDNVHEIHAESGTAAFVDLLSPPYNHHLGPEHRPCNYYREVQTDTNDPSLRYLIHIKAPSDYWCDEAKYCGPVLPVPPST